MPAAAPGAVAGSSSASARALKNPCGIPPLPPRPGPASVCRTPPTLNYYGGRVGVDLKPPTVCSPSGAGAFYFWELAFPCYSQISNVPGASRRLGATPGRGGGHRCSMERRDRRKQGVPCFAAWLNRGGAGGVAKFRDRGVTSPGARHWTNGQGQGRVGARIHAVRRRVAWREKVVGMFWKNTGSEAPARSLLDDGSFSSWPDSPQQVSETGGLA